MKEILFSLVVLKNKTLQNRFAAQAMEGNDGENGGKPSNRTVERYKKYCEGKWGLIVVEAISVVESPLARINGMILKKDNLLSFKRLVDEMKKINPSVCVLFQITHSGEHSGPFAQRVTLNSSKGEGYRLLETDEIDRIRDAFVSASVLAYEAGADGIDFKMCHGYLGAEMLRPSNDRSDKWGGSFENRTRLLKEAVTEIKSKIKSKDFILGSRVSMYEGIRGGCGTCGKDEIIEDLSEMLDVIRLMNKLGMNYVNVSAGIPAVTGAITRPTEPSKYLALAHLRYAKTVKEMIDKERLSLKVIGSAYSTHQTNAPELCAEMITKNYVDICGFGRQIFADPLTPAKLQEEKPVNWCVLCSGCSKLMLNQINDGCIVFNDYYKSEFKNMQKEKK